MSKSVFLKVSSLKYYQVEVMQPLVAVCWPVSTSIGFQTSILYGGGWTKLFINLGLDFGEQICSRVQTWDISGSFASFSHNLMTGLQVLFLSAGGFWWIGSVLMVFLCLPHCAHTVCRNQNGGWWWRLCWKVFILFVIINVVFILYRRSSFPF